MAITLVLEAIQIPSFVGLSLLQSAKLAAGYASIASNQ